MYRTFLYVLFVATVTELVYAGSENMTTALAITLPQPSTILICTAGIGFFRYVSKRVP